MDEDDGHGQDNWTYVTDEERVEFVERRMEALESREQFFHLGLVAFKLELRCIEHHFEHICEDVGHSERIVWHLHNLVQHLPHMMAAALGMIPESELARVEAQIAADGIQRKTGHPYIAVEVDDGTWAVGPEIVAVPDNLSELDDDGS